MTSATQRRWKALVVTPIPCAIAVFLLIITPVLMANYYALGIDWMVFHNATFTDPYSAEGFVSPPWVLLLLPHRVLPARLSNAVNLLINIAVVLYAIKALDGGWKTALIVLTSPIFYDFARVNNVDWIPLLGLLAGPQLGPVFMSCKPHVLSGAVLVWMKRDWRVILIPLSILLLSFVVWGWWPTRISYNPTNKFHNLSPFPAGIPIGIWLLRKAWKEDDIYLAAVTTPLFSPYVHTSRLPVYSRCYWSRPVNGREQGRGCRSGCGRS